jgi:predicted DNA-binding transcriptional regulator AlpA
MSTERIGIADVARILGESPRTVQAMAARGDIPSALKLAKRWTFRETAVRAWVEDREDQVWQKEQSRRPVRTGGGTLSGGVSRSPVARSDSAYERMMQKLRSAGSKPAASAR